MPSASVYVPPPNAKYKSQTSCSMIENNNIQASTTSIGGRWDFNIPPNIDKHTHYPSVKREGVMYMLKVGNATKRGPLGRGAIHIYWEDI